MLGGIWFELIRDILFAVGHGAAALQHWPFWIAVPAAILAGLSIVASIDGALEKRRNARKGDDA